MTSNRDDDEPDNTRLRWYLGTLLLLAIPVAVIWWPGCREYPPVTSRESLTLVKLLYAACNTKDPNRLSEVERRIEKLQKQGKITKTELDAFNRIVEQAKRGDWPAAEQAAFQFAQDQVGQGK